MHANGTRPEVPRRSRVARSPSAVRSGRPARWTSTLWGIDPPKSYEMKPYPGEPIYGDNHDCLAGGASSNGTGRMVVDGQFPKSMDSAADRATAARVGHLPAEQHHERTGEGVPI